MIPKDTVWYIEHDNVGPNPPCGTAVLIRAKYDQARAMHERLRLTVAARDRRIAEMERRIKDDDEVDREYLEEHLQGMKVAFCKRIDALQLEVDNAPDGASQERNFLLTCSHALRRNQTGSLRSRFNAWQPSRGSGIGQAAPLRVAYCKGKPAELEINAPCNDWAILEYDDESTRRARLSREHFNLPGRQFTKLAYSTPSSSDLVAWGYPNGRDWIDDPNGHGEVVTPEGASGFSEVDETKPDCVLHSRCDETFPGMSGSGVFSGEGMIGLHRGAIEQVGFAEAVRADHIRSELEGAGFELCDPPEPVPESVPLFKWILAVLLVGIASFYILLDMSLVSDVCNSGKGLSAERGLRERVQLWFHKKNLHILNREQNAERTVNHWPKEILCYQTVTIIPLDSDATFTIAESLVIPKDATLKIESGCRLNFSPNTGICCHGSLKFEGSEIAPIVLSADDPKLGWSGIYFEDSVEDSDPDSGSNFDWCHFMHGRGTSTSVEKAAWVWEHADERNHLFHSELVWSDADGKKWLPFEWERVGDGRRRGGAVCLNRSEGIAFNNCIFAHNQSQAGGAIAAYCCKDIEIIECHFKNNIASNNGQNGLKRAPGGACYFQQTRSGISITGGEFSSNWAMDYHSCGGAIYFGSGSDCSLTNVDFTENIASHVGGAIYATSKKNETLNGPFDRASDESPGSKISFTGCNFHNNRAWGSLVDGERQCPWDVYGQGEDIGVDSGSSVGLYSCTIDNRLALSACVQVDQGYWGCYRNAVTSITLDRYTKITSSQKGVTAAVFPEKNSGPNNMGFLNTESFSHYSEFWEVRPYMPKAKLIGLSPLGTQALAEFSRPRPREGKDDGDSGRGPLRRTQPSIISIGFVGADDVPAAVELLREKQRAPHYLLSADGHIYSVISENLTALHGRQDEDSSIGIDVVAPQRGLTQIQNDGLDELLTAIDSRHAIVDLHLPELAQEDPNLAGLDLDFEVDSP